MLRITLLVFLMSTLSCGNALNLDFLCKHDDTTFRCVEYVRNYDGDTITVNIPNTPPIIGIKMPIRISGIDTPEIKGKTIEQITQEFS